MTYKISEKSNPWNVHTMRHNPAFASKEINVNRRLHLLKLSQYTIGVGLYNKWLYCLLPFRIRCQCFALGANTCGSVLSLL